MRRKIEKQGKVVSAKMDKTVVVVSETLYPHPLYKKIIKRRTKFYAHDAENRCQEGDEVKIRFTRPLSKLKRWVVIENLSAKQREVEKNK
jgi:small subunit ribosomal protein S17